MVSLVADFELTKKSPKALAERRHFLCCLCHLAASFFGEGFGLVADMIYHLTFNKTLR